MKCAMNNKGFSIVIGKHNCEVCLDDLEHSMQTMGWTGEILPPWANNKTALKFKNKNGQQVLTYK